MTSIDAISDRDAAMSIPGCRVTETGLEIHGELTSERWESIGHALSSINRSVNWVIGDWLLAGEDAGYLPRGKLREACERFGIAYDTAAQTVSVCRSYPKSCRRLQLSFGHHHSVASCDNAEELLTWAEKTSSSVKELRNEKKRREVTNLDLDDTSTTDSLQFLIDDGRKFGTIYADPPWQYGNQGTRAATDNHYGTMPKDDIARLPIGELAADRCHLHLWTTNGFLKDALDLIERWGFEFKSTFVWVKPQLGIGNYWRCSHELMLLGVKGGLTFPPSNIKSWIEQPRTRHSAKPPEVRKLIEQLSPGPRLELFSRAIVDGWVMWGNQIEHGMFDGNVPVLK